MPNPDILPAPATSSSNGQAEEVRDIQAFVRVFKWVRKHWREICFGIWAAVMLLKGDTSVLKLMGLKFEPPKIESAMEAAPAGENWKTSVDRRLATLEKQNRTIIKLLTEP